MIETYFVHLFIFALGVFTLLWGRFVTSYQYHLLSSIFLGSGGILFIAYVLLLFADIHLRGFLTEIGIYVFTCIILFTSLFLDFKNSSAKIVTWGIVIIHFPFLHIVFFYFLFFAIIGKKLYEIPEVYFSDGERRIEVVEVAPMIGGSQMQLIKEGVVLEEKILIKRWFGSKKYKFKIDTTANSMSIYGRLNEDMYLDTTLLKE